MYDAQPEIILNAMAEGLRPYMAETTRIVQADLKRWRYANPTRLHSAPYLLAKELPPLVFAGDAFDGPRVEGALLSGWAAGKALADRLANPT
jgi:renalase